MLMRRCCKDSITFARLRDEPTEGLEIACRWNDEYVRYERIGGTDVLGWVVHERVSDFVNREADLNATEAREKAYARILGKERER